MNPPRTEKSSVLSEAHRAGRAFLRVVFLFSIFTNLLMLTGPLFMLQIYDRVLASRSEATLLALFGLVAFLYGILAVLEFSRGRLVARYGARLQEALDRPVFRVVLLRAIHPAERSGPAKGLRDIEALQNFFASPVVLAFFDLPWVPIFFLALFLFHPWLGWLGVFGGIVLVIVTLVNQRLTKAKTEDALSESAKASNLAEEARRTAQIIRAQGMEGTITKRWLDQRFLAQTKTVASSDLTTVFTSFSKSWRMFLQSAMLALGAYLVLKEELTPGAMIAGSIILGRALAPIEQALGQWKLVQRSRAGWKTLERLLESAPPDAELTALPRPEAHLMLSNVTVLAPGGQAPTLRSVSLEVLPGQCLGVIGPAGSGKSTLARVMTYVWPVHSGEVRLGGASLDQYPRDARGALIGYLPQEMELFTGTITENIARMSMSPDEDAVIRAAQLANAHEMILDLPEGYNTTILGNGSSLSGGQRQRIALARAFFGDPAILILDEPNSALDDAGSNALIDAIAKFKTTGGSVVIMTHRPSALKECDNLIVLYGGTVRKAGARDEVLRSFLPSPGKVPEVTGSDQ